MPTTLVIGRGISASAYLETLRRGRDERVRIVGGPDLWNRLDRDHDMGQPANLLTGNLLGRGAEHRNYHDPQQTGFMEAGEFADLLNESLEWHGTELMPEDFVTGISRARRRYRVAYSRQGLPGTVDVDRVVIAIGPGPARRLQVPGGDGDIDVDVDAYHGQVVTGGDFMEPAWHPPHPPGFDDDLHVAIYGGSATASWVVELARMRGLNVRLWFTRPGRGGGAWDAEQRFATAFPPGGRNTAVYRQYAGAREVLRLLEVQRLIPLIGRPVLALKFERGDGQTEYRFFDLLVYSLGYEHRGRNGVRGLLDDEIDGTLVPFYDRNLAVSHAQALLAIGTPDRSLMIIGSSMSSAGGLPRDRLRDLNNTVSQTIAPYADIARTLPPAARPTEGIAMVMASIEALNEYMPARATGGEASYTVGQRIGAERTGPHQPRQGRLNPSRGSHHRHATRFQWDINLNTANRTQIAAYLAQTTDLEAFAANLAVALIVKLRGFQTFGLDEDQVGAICRFGELVHAHGRRTYPHFDRQRREQDRLTGAEGFLNWYVDRLLEVETNQRYFQHHGIATRA